MARRALSWALGVTMLCGGAAGAQAEDWPKRGIRIISPYAAGGVGDTIFRIISPPIEADLGQRFIIDNRSGANGNIGTGEAVRAAPDGYTFVFAPTANYAVNQGLFKLGYDPIAQLDPVATVAEAPLMAIVPATMPARTLKELAEQVKRGGGRLNFGSPGTGSPTSLAGLSFNLQNGGSMEHIPYRGSPPLLQALLAGDVQLAFTTLSPVLEHVRAGKLRALAVMSDKRLPDAPDVPTAAEAGFPDMLFGNWWALAAPRGTDPEVRERLANEIKVALAKPDIQARLREIGHVPVFRGPADTTAFLKSESVRYKALIDKTGIKVE